MERLAPTDEFALVAYDDQVTLVAPLGPANRPELLPLIASIRPGGQTNLSGEWLKGMEVLKGATGPGVISRIRARSPGQAGASSAK